MTSIYEALHDIREKSDVDIKKLFGECEEVFLEKDKSEKKSIEIGAVLCEYLRRQLLELSRRTLAYELLRRNGKLDTEFMRILYSQACIETLSLLSPNEVVP